MKTGADNFRESSILDVVNILQNNGHEIIVYEPNLMIKNHEGFEIENDFNKFIENSGIIIANRIDSKIKNLKDKVFTRDIFSRD